MNESEKARLSAALEAILFTMGQAVETSVIAKATDISEDEVRSVAESLRETLEKEDRGIRLIRLETAYQLCSKAEYYPTLIRVASQPKRPVLTEVMLEVLSIISYRQPVTRGEIDRIRGVSSDYSVNRLIDYGLIEERGRQDSPGRPILFGTTEEFLRKFGLSSVTELPPLSEDYLEMVHELDLESEMEGQMSFDLSDDGKAEET